MKVRVYEKESSEQDCTRQVNNDGGLQRQWMGIPVLTYEEQGAFYRETVHCRKMAYNFYRFLQCELDTFVHQTLESFNWRMEGVIDTIS